MTINNDEWDITSKTLRNYRGSQKSITIPEGVYTIYMGALANKNLTNIKFPTSLNLIYPFACKDNDLTIINLPHNLEHISSEAFSFNKLREVNFPPTLESIGDEAFSHNKLTSIYLPDSVIKIEDYAFDCNHLERVILSDKVSIGYRSIPKCLKEIYIHNITHQVPRVISQLFERLELTGSEDLKIIVFGTKLTYFEKLKIKALLKGLNISLIENLNFEPTSPTKINGDAPDEIEVLKSQISTITSTLSIEEKTTIDNIVNHFIAKYKERLNTLDSNISLDDTINLNLASSSPKDLKKDLIINLEKIIMDLNANLKYQSLLTKILDYENYCLSVADIPDETTNDQIKFIINVSKFYHLDYLLSKLKEILTTTKKEISSYIIDTFSSEIKLSLEKNIDLEFNRKISVLYEESIKIHHIERVFQGLENTKISHVLKLFNELISSLDELHKNEIEKEFLHITTKYKTKLLTSATNSEEIYQELLTELKPLSISLNKKVSISLRFKETLNEINRGILALTKEDERGILSDTIGELKIILNNPLLQPSIKEEALTRINSLLTTWQNNITTKNEEALTDYFKALRLIPNWEERTILSDLNFEVIILLLKELYNLKFKLEQIILLKEEINTERKI